MPLTKSEIKILEFLPLNEWVQYRKLPTRTNIVTIRSLLQKNLIQAVILYGPSQITDQDVDSCKVSMEVLPFNDLEWQDPSFVKKLTNDYRTEENEAALLRERVAILERKLAAIERGIEIQ